MVFLVKMAREADTVLYGQSARGAISRLNGAEISYTVVSLLKRDHISHYHAILVILVAKININTYIPLSPAPAPSLLLCARDAYLLPAMIDASSPHCPGQHGVAMSFSPP